ncbi:alkane hydroxylase MAH1-like [Rutidosis leptorrhynchoides]|uniref:alkane hydroxylase MAH1-like n=1 Tax=Rutidosis leptorrhynchoides TaxID=125765 RepID=UPI003A997D74
MASLLYFDKLIFIIFLISCTVFFLRRRRGLPIDLPVLGMTLETLLNAHRIHDYVTDILKLSHGNFLLKGPWFANIHMLVTSDPANVHYMLSKNFHNYPKGPDFRFIFDILGDGIFNSDHELWELHRKTTMSLFKQPEFLTLLDMNIKNKVEKGLLPLLEQCQELDLQEIFQRFTFDNVCALLLDYDPESLSPNLPILPCEKAFTVVEEALLWRHILPTKVWKLQKRFGLGKEKKMKEAWKAFDDFIYKCLSRKEVEVEERGLLTSLMRGFEGQSGTSGDSRQFIKDAILNLMFAGRDTTSTSLSWFFYLLAQNPCVEKKIREEIKTQLGGEKWKCLGIKQLEGMNFLHGGICEALRLYPPVALEHKSPSEADILPSGHVVDKHTRIILSFYSMGRMKGIWGEDCMEFKPERWFSRGSIKHEPSYKFPAFHAGPRTCLGKEMSFIQMKMVASAIIFHYHVKLVQGHQVCPSDSVLLQMKYGLKVKLFPVISDRACE